MPRWVELSGGGEPGQPSGSPKLEPWEQDWVEPVSDFSETGWIAESIHRRGSQTMQRYAEGRLVPDGFAAYARLFHPAQVLNEAKEHLPVRWAQIAAERGRTMHPWATFYDVANVHEWISGRNGGVKSSPKEWSLPSAECAILAGLVREFTETPDLYYFGFWDGYGQADRFPAMRRQPRFRLHTIEPRGYYLLRGRLDPALAGKHFAYHSPNIWWPADRAWCISTDIDGMDTWVGGSAELIRRITSHPALEALPVNIDDWVDFGGDADSSPPPPSQSRIARRLASVFPCLFGRRDTGQNSGGAGV